MNKLQKKIIQLKHDKDVLIFAHNYQIPEIQELADYVGDSLFLAKKIKNIPKGKRIIYASVKFMAETAVLLNHGVEVYFPISKALCPMAKFCSPKILQEYKENNPDIPIILYINTTTESKQYADVICTSSNAVKVAQKIIEQTSCPKIAFGPDKNLGKFIKNKLDVPVDIIPENGRCFVHDKLDTKDLEKFRKKHPEAKIIAHPECRESVLREADFIGSTSAMYKYVMRHPNQHIGIGTETGLIDRLKRERKNLQIWPLSPDTICRTMKKYTLSNIIKGLENIDHGLEPLKLDKNLLKKAKIPIEKMFQLTHQPNKNLQN